MAGSWNHIVDGKGRFDGSRLVHENGGDTVEALEECYGVVWYLATQLAWALAPDGGAFDPPALVEEARRDYKAGLEASPGFTTNAARQRINHDKAWGEHTPQPYTEKEN